MGRGRAWTAATLAAAIVAGSHLAVGSEPPLPHLESRRLRSNVVYLGTVSAIRRLGALDGLTGEDQGRLEATLSVVRVLRAPAGATPPAEVAVFFDSRAPEPEGEGFYTLAPGEAVLVFADGFEPAYPRGMLHGAPRDLAARVKAVRDWVAAMDADRLRLHGLTPPTRTAQVRLYDQARNALVRLPAR